MLRCRICHYHYSSFLNKFKGKVRLNLSKTNTEGLCGLLKGYKAEQWTEMTSLNCFPRQQ